MEIWWSETSRVKYLQEILGHFNRVMIDFMDLLVATLVVVCSDFWHYDPEGLCEMYCACGTVEEEKLRCTLTSVSVNLLHPFLPHGQ